jgi:hypothetical protein
MQHGVPMLPYAGADTDVYIDNPAPGLPGGECNDNTPDAPSLISTQIGPCALGIAPRRSLVGTS